AYDGPTSALAPDLVRGLRRVDHARRLPAGQKPAPPTRSTTAAVRTLAWTPCCPRPSRYVRFPMSYRFTVRATPRNASAYATKATLRSNADRTRSPMAMVSRGVRPRMNRSPTRNHDVHVLGTPT